MNRDEQTIKVRELNDAFRKGSWEQGGRVVLTRGINALGLPFTFQCMMAVRKFEDFNANNDPHGEHDLGTFQINGHDVMWKLDTYSDAECQWGSEEPWNADLSYRVITILLAEEY